jgi:DNA-binding NtrC family response regulator
MAEPMLRGRHILVVEDEYLLAEELMTVLEERQATVLGPVGRLGDALDLVGSATRIDGAILDVNLCGEMAFPIADALAARSVPFLFTTGYDRSAIPSRFASALQLEKPLQIETVIDALERAAAARADRDPR